MLNYSGHRFIDYPSTIVALVVICLSLYASLTLVTMFNGDFKFPKFKKKLKISSEITKNYDLENLTHFIFKSNKENIERK